MGPDWSLLPPELIQLISEKILFTNVYYRFRAVCRSWRGTSPQPRHISPVPWLALDLRPERIPSTPNNSRAFCYFDFSKSEIHHFYLPSHIAKRVVGSSRSWLVLNSTDSQLSLINPITGDMKDNIFPSLAAAPNILGFAFTPKTKKASDLAHFVGAKAKHHIDKIVLTGSPFDENCTIIASFYTSDSPWELAFSRAGDSCWTVLRLPERGRGNRTMVDFKYQNGLIYAINDKCHISVYNLRDLSQKIMPANLSYYRYGSDRVYFVTGEMERDGPLIVRHVDPFMREDQFEVFKCYDEYGHGTRYRYKRVRDIGNNVLFIDDQRCLLVSCDDIRSDGWTKNHICYYDRKPVVYNQSYHVTIKMLNIKDSSVTEVEYSSVGLFSERSMDPSWFSSHLY